MPELMPDRTTDEAFAALLQLHRPRMLALLRRLCPTDAEDLLQETVAKVWRLRAGCELHGNVAGWLLQAAFRSFLDHRQRRRRDIVADTDSVQAASAELPCAAELRDELERGLQRLSPLQRALLLGFHQEQLSLQQLARRHRLPLNTVKSHLHRARQLLVPRNQEDRR